MCDDDMDDDAIIYKDAYGDACAFCGIEDGSCDCVVDRSAERSHADIRGAIDAYRTITGNQEYDQSALDYAHNNLLWALNKIERLLAERSRNEGGVQ